MAVTEPYRKLIKLYARAFYDGEILGSAQGEKPKKGKSSRGLAVVVLDTLMRRQWIKEEELAKDLQLHSKQVKKVVKILQDEGIVVRDSRKEAVTKDPAKAPPGAKGDIKAEVKAEFEQETKPPKPPGGEEEEDGAPKTRYHTYSYCAIDYALALDVMRYRLLRARKKLRDEVDDKNVVQEYVCPGPNCGAKYSAHDAAALLNFEDHELHCSNCDTVLIEDSADLAKMDIGTKEDNERRRRREAVKDMLARIEVQIKPLSDQLENVRNLPPPVTLSLSEWILQNSVIQQAMGPDGKEDRKGHAAAQIPLPFMGETQVKVEIAGAGGPAQAAQQEAAAPLKQLPPWMIRQSMTNLTAEQRGEYALPPGLVEERVKGDPGLVKPEPEQAAFAVKPEPGLVEEEGLDPEAEQRRIQEEYAKAYYAAYQESLRKAQEEAAVSAKVKQEPGEAKGEDEGMEWEEGRSDGGQAGVDVRNQEQEEGAYDDEEWEEGGAADVPPADVIEGAGVGAPAHEEDELEWEEGD